MEYINKLSYDVFISYESTTGEGCAENLKKALKKNNQEAFLASDDLLSGVKWRKEIDSALKEARFFVIIYTANTEISPEVKRELEKALEMGKHIIPCIYKGVLQSESYIDELHQIKFIDYSDLANKFILEIRRIMSSKVVQ